MVRGEAVLHTPQDGLGPAADSDLAVDRADVRLTVFGLRYVSAATSALLLPWVMRARISDSRSLSPSPRPGQSSPTALRARAGTSLMTVCPA